MNCLLLNKNSDALFDALKCVVSSGYPNLLPQSVFVMASPLGASGYLLSELIIQYCAKLDTDTARVMIEDARKYDNTQFNGWFFINDLQGYLKVMKPDIDATNEVFEVLATSKPKTVRVIVWDGQHWYAEHVPCDLSKAKPVSFNASYLTS